MQYRVPEYYNEFSCIGDKCPDTCCSGWEVVLDNSATEYYETLDGSVGKKLSAVIIESEGETRFELRKNGDCPFLNCNHLCDLQLELGHGGLCRTCRMFPRYVTELAGSVDMGISFSCPRAIEIILGSSQKTGFTTFTDETQITEYNDIDPKLYISLERTRSELITILQNREENIYKRIVRALRLAENLESKSGNGCRFRLKLPLRRKVQPQTEACVLLDTYLGFEFINDDFKTLFECANVFVTDGKTGMSDIIPEYELEQLAVYYVHRYFMKAVFDGEILMKLKYLAAGAIAITELCRYKWLQSGLDREARWEIFRLYSKETEYSEFNMETLTNTLAGRHFTTKILSEILELYSEE